MIVLKIIFLIILAFVMIAVYWMYTGHKKRQILFNGNLEKYYPANRFSESKRVKAIEVLKRFDDKYHYYLFGFKSFFKLYPKSPFKKSNDIAEEMKYYRSDFLNVHEQALQMIGKLLFVKYTIECQIEYFEDNIDSAEDTIDNIKRDTEIKEYFPELYSIRLNNLDNFVLHNEKIIDHLEEQQDKIEDAIDELEEIKKKSFLRRVGEFSWNMLSAPVRRIVNLAEGIITKDDSKIDKNLIMLIFGAVGIGLLEEAIDSFDLIDASEDNLIKQSVSDINSSNGYHFVEPHTRTLSDGNVIWVDGDGDTSIDLAVEEGGGYYRSNPDGNPNNNFNS
ncbi:hypothetical protein J7I93_03740 [Bacillus sp. ISL-47]|uniref:hypothetical protein n=1 Tax=Bacillus sp. ISL-47 TaxID=2819130 RepID=UPI001BE8DB81|nr:hypothetical protein [Bacillus sp. ISL-47]MBT2687289.1 hypothetical protein [Bacillus sp. ISL-47]MBT2706641.1 hypothetical protein [Pseudomonas sp. ISL-84]